MPTLSLPVPHLFKNVQLHKNGPREVVEGARKRSSKFGLFELSFGFFWFNKKMLDVTTVI